MSFFLNNINNNGDEGTFEFDPGDIVIHQPCTSSLIAQLPPAIEKPKRKNPIAHRLVEKNRRDRLNRQLQVLKSLLPLRKQKVLSFIREIIDKSRDTMLYTLIKAKNNKIGKLQIIEIATQYIKRLQKELRNDRMTPMMKIDDNDSYKKGLHDGFDAILQFTKRFNEIEFQIKAKILEHMELIKNSVLNERVSSSKQDQDQDQQQQQQSEISNENEFDYVMYGDDVNQYSLLSPIEQQEHEKEENNSISSSNSNSNSNSNSSKMMMCAARKYKSDLISTFLEYQRKSSDQYPFNL